MIDHICIDMSSQANCREVFEEVLGLSAAYSFWIDGEFMDRMFGVKAGCAAAVYRAGDMKIEVFIRPELERPVSRTAHLCLAVPDRKKVLESARARGLAVLHHPRAGRPLYYIRDRDGNYFEIKEIVSGKIQEK